MVLARFQRGVDTRRVQTQTLREEEAAASPFPGAVERWMNTAATR